MGTCMGRTHRQFLPRPPPLGFCDQAIMASGMPANAPSTKHELDIYDSISGSQWTLATT